MDNSKLDDLIAKNISAHIIENDWVVLISIEQAIRRSKAKIGNKNSVEKSSFLKCSFLQNILNRLFKSNNG